MTSSCSGWSYRQCCTVCPEWWATNCFLYKKHKQTSPMNDPIIHTSSGSCCCGYHISRCQHTTVGQVAVFPPSFPSLGVPCKKPSLFCGPAICGGALLLSLVVIPTLNRAGTRLYSGVDYRFSETKNVIALTVQNFLNTAMRLPNIQVYEHANKPGKQSLHFVASLGAFSSKCCLVQVSQTLWEASRRFQSCYSQTPSVNLCEGQLTTLLASFSRRSSVSTKFKITHHYDRTAQVHIEHILRTRQYTEPEAYALPITDNVS